MINTKKQLTIHLFILAAMIAVFEFTNTDILVQDHFYQFEQKRWLIDKHDPIMRLLFYSGPKSLIIAFGVLTATLATLSFFKPRLEHLRNPTLKITIALIAVPLTVSILKSTTNVYTPAQLQHYQGNKPYVKIFQKYPETFNQLKPGKGWPAGHASAGFALMALYFAFKRKSHKIAGLILALTIGSAMGLYQMLKGAHFLSHTLVTIAIAWIIILIVNQLTENSNKTKSDSQLTSNNLKTLSTQTIEELTPSQTTTSIH